MKVKRNHSFRTIFYN